MQVAQVNGMGYDSNVYLVMDKKNILIDTGTGMGKAFESMIYRIKKQIPIESVESILLTHNHFDHSGGAKKLSELTNADVYIHRDDSQALIRGDNVFTGARMYGGSQERLDVLTLNEDDIIDLGDAKLAVLHTPGHTPGSISLYEERTKALFCGDLIFANGGFGRYDLIGGDGEKLYRSGLKISTLDVRNLYPGHGEWVENEGKKHIDLALKEIKMQIRGES